MKLFMPVYAAALTLAVTSDLLELASATDCLASDVCPSNTCASVTDGAANPEAVTTALAGFSTTCTGGTKAYISKLSIIADPGDVGSGRAATSITNINVKVSKTADAVSPSATPLTQDAAPACDNQFSDIGKTDATDDVKATISCTAAPCAFTYKAVYACQAPDACDATVCTSDTVCPPVSTTSTSGAVTSAPLTRPATGLTCATGKFAYISKIQIFAGAAVAASSTPATAADDIQVRATTDGSTVPTDNTGLVPKDPFPACANTFTSIGQSATADVKASIGCASGMTCNFKYKATWVCQPADSCALTTCKDCTAVNVPTTTALALTKPVDLTCDSGKFAYISSLELGVAGAKTTADEITVAFTNGASTKLDATKDATVCDGKWTDVGKTAATADIQGSVSCTDATNGCDIKYKVAWMCQASAVTAAPTSGGAGFCPVAAWGSALVAAVAGANFAAPL